MAAASVPAVPSKWVYKFGGGSSDGRITMKSILGGKGAGLAEMAHIGLNVPPGFTITAEACGAYDKSGNLPKQLFDEVDSGLEFIERTMKASFGGRDGASNILLVSVRSGAAVSMPGMMDTVLNLGLGDACAARMIAATHNPRFVWDSYRRLVDMYGDVVAGVKHELFEKELNEMKAAVGASFDTDLTADQLCALVEQYKGVFKRATGHDFPQDPVEQLKQAIKGVFGSWNNPRAVTYRKINHIHGLLGTAVNVQSMVYGNMGSESGSGVLFTRNPSTGVDELYGEVLMNSQGEDVVAGIRTPLPIKQLDSIMPEIYKEIYEVVKRLEAHMRDMQDVEFTIQERRLFILQCRDGKRTGAAALRIAADMVASKVVSEEYAVRKLVTPGHIDQLLHPRFKSESGYKANLLAKGMAASPGAAVGRVVFTAEDAAAWKERGETVILVRSETSAEDVGGMHCAQGILTAHGGMTSHAAVVARGWGKPCVTGCGDLKIDAAGKVFVCTPLSKSLTPEVGFTVVEGDWISIHGGTGEVIWGKQELVATEVTPELTAFSAMSARFCPIHVHANADNREDALVALQFGARGIGLVRTEHMFWGPERIHHMRDVILGSTTEQRQSGLDALLVVQQGDFRDIFMAVAAAAKAEGRPCYPVTIRLLDPPLHEYLPYQTAQQEELAKDFGMTHAALLSMIAILKEANPMMGCRGVRVSITKPEIARMQARAIITAACEVQREGHETNVEIMIPLVGTLAETAFVKQIVDEVAAEVMAALNVRVGYKVGTMIETPRACLDAGNIAKAAEFFSFGTNDLTAMTFGYSRDDAPKWIPRYIEVGILPDDPFITLDKEGVGELVRMAVERGRETRPGMSVGVCGEVGGDERSVPFFIDCGVDYVSCSPYRVPVALLAIAQAGIARAAAVAATKS